MVTKFMLRPHFLSPPRSFFFNLSLFPKPLSLSLLSTTVTANSASVSSFDLAFPYGPSLRKGDKPLPSITPSAADDHSSAGEMQEFAEEVVIDREKFTRVFDISALRVPSEHCFALESRLRGHLLNWPRIRNIARVPGDEVDDEFRHFVEDQTNSDSKGDDSERLTSLSRRIHGKAEGDGEPLSPVLYRDKLAKTFDSRGFEKFRNLAKLSRPKKKKKLEKEKNHKKGIGKNEFAMVEVMEEGEEKDFSGLLGEEFNRSKWRGSTRLLLLDERYADKGLHQFPEAIKAVLKEDNNNGTESSIELVRCKLTLFYDYWQMNEVLADILPDSVIVPSAFETVGHIAHLNLKDEHLPYKKIIARVVLDKNKPKIQTVVNKIDAIHNDYRTMQLEVLAGNRSLVATVVENGLRFHVDLATVYWNSRLATERQRLLRYFNRDDVVSLPLILAPGSCYSSPDTTQLECNNFADLMTQSNGSYNTYGTNRCLVSGTHHILQIRFDGNNLAAHGDVFAGVGPLAVTAAKKVKYVYANDLNPYAVQYLEANSVLNKLERKIEVFNMDGRRFIDVILASDETRPITQVVMNLPNDAADYLDIFRGIFRRKPRNKEITYPKIHVYGFSKASDPEFDFEERIRIALSEVAFEVETRRVRLVAPGKWMLCASFVLPESVAFSKPMLYM